MSLRPEPTTPLASVRYALRVLESAARRPDGVTESRLSADTGLPTAHLTALLLMLRREGYLEQAEDGAYTAGPSLISLGLGSTGERRQALDDRIDTLLADLRDDVGAAVYLSRYADGEAEVMRYADGPTTPAVNEWVDFRSSLHATAIGKCLLSQLDHDTRRDHLSRHRPARLTSRTITDPGHLLRTVDRHPPTVPVLDLQEYAVGTVCAAVPVTAGSSVGTLALSLPVEDAHRLRRAAETLNRRAAPLMLSLAI